MQDADYAEEPDYADYAEYAGYAEYAEELTADGAYHCPVGRIRPFFSHPLRRSARLRRAVQYNLSACEAAFTCMLVPIQLDMMRPVTLIIVI